MMTFNETELSPEILKATEELGFKNPTPIQEKSIPSILNTENDLIALAQTGTGKTAAFGLPIIHKTDLKLGKIQTLILCPTRELCMQITNDLVSYSKYIKNFKVTAVYGGANIVPQIKSLKDGCQAVVGTPGRTLDLIRRKALKITHIKWLVLDEADEMLNMGFKEDLDSILADTPQEKRTFLFSATMPKEIRQIANKYMSKPEEISVGKRNSGADDVSHEYYMVQAKDRYKALKRIADINPNIYGIAFCRTRRETKEVADKLINDGYNADSLHGDLSQAQRDHVMNRFRSKHLQILVATDVAARGLDVNDLSHVINYNLPDELEAYIHRSGRTGRAGKKGISISIIHTRESRKIKDLEKISGKKFEKKDVPTGRDICEKQLFNLIEKVEKVNVDNSQIDEYLPAINAKLEWLSREELIKHFVSAEFSRFLSYYKNAPDLNVRQDSRSDLPDRSDRSGRSGRSDRKEGKGKSGANLSRFFINVGSNNHLNTARLIGLINEQTRDRNLEIGKIDIMKKFSFFEVDKKVEDSLQKAFKNAVFEGVSIVVQLSKPDKKAEFKRSSDGNDRYRKKRKRSSGRRSNNY